MEKQKTTFKRKQPQNSDIIFFFNNSSSCSAFLTGRQSFVLFFLTSCCIVNSIINEGERSVYSYDVLLLRSGFGRTRHGSISYAQGPWKNTRSQTPSTKYFYLEVQHGGSHSEHLRSFWMILVHVNPTLKNACLVFSGTDMYQAAMWEPHWLSCSTWDSISVLPYNSGGSAFFASYLNLEA